MALLVSSDSRQLENTAQETQKTYSCRNLFDKYRCDFIFGCSASFKNCGVPIDIAK